MLGNWLEKRASAWPVKGNTDTPAPASAHPPALSSLDQALAVQFLCRKDSVMPLSPDEAVQIARYLVPRQYQSGELQIGRI